jgi:hypothetical protein
MVSAQEQQAADVEHSSSTIAKMECSICIASMEVLSSLNDGKQLTTRWYSSASFASIALPYKFSRQHLTIFLELIRSRAKENTEFPDS